MNVWKGFAMRRWNGGMTMNDYVRGCALFAIGLVAVWAAPAWGDPTDEGGQDEREVAQNDASPSRPRNTDRSMREYGERKVREAAAASATQPGDASPIPPKDDIKSEAQDIDAPTEEEVAERLKALRERRERMAKEERAKEQEELSKEPAITPQAGPAWTQGGKGGQQTPPNNVDPNAGTPSVPPSQRGNTDPVNAKPGEIVVTVDPEKGTFQSSQLKLVAPEDRPYFISWLNTPFQKCAEDLVEMTSLSMVGFHLIQPNSVGNLTLRTPHVMTFDEMLTFINYVIFDKNVWIVRRDDYLVIRNLTEWYQRIPTRRIYQTAEAYEQADLPGWEIATFYYEPKALPSAQLAQSVMDTIPLNALRATLVPDSNLIEIKGFVYFLDEKLAYLRGIDVKQPPPVDWKEYKLEHAAPETAADLLMTLMDMSGSAKSSASGGRVTRQRGGRPNPQQPNAPGSVGESQEDAIDIKPINSRNSLLIRASEVNHTKIAEYIEKYIDIKSDDELPVEIIKMKFADPGELVELIQPLLGEKQEYQPPSKPVKPGTPPPPPPPVQIRTVGTTAEMIPLPPLSSILVKANKQEMAKIKAYIEMLDIDTGGDEPFEIVTMNYATASNVANIVRTVISGQRSRSPRRTSSADSFTATADNINDKIIVLQGSEKELEEAKSLIARLDVDPLQGAIQKLVTIENTDPRVISEILGQRYGSNTRSRYNISSTPSLPSFIPDDNSSTLMVLCREEAWPEIERLIKELDERAEVQNRTHLYKLENANVADVLPVLQQVLGDTNSRAVRMPLRNYLNTPEFIAIEETNGLLVSGDEKAHQKVKDMLPLLDVKGTVNEFRPIELEKADAEYVAQKVEELFASSGSSSRSPYSYRRTGYGSSSSSGAQVRVIAEPVTNRILVAASDGDFAKAKSLAESIDAEYIAKKYERRLFPLQYADPNEVEQAVASVFEAEQVSSGRYGSRSSTVDAPPTVRTVGTGNGLVVIATEDKMKDIEEFINELDTDRMSGNEMRTYKVKSSDSRGSYGLAQTLTDMYGRGGRYGQNTSNVRFMGDYGSELLIVSAPKTRMPEIDKMVKEMIKSKEPDEIIFKHFDLKEADPKDMAELLEPILEDHYEGEQGYSSRWYGGGGMEPRVVAHTTARKIMVAGTPSVIDLAERMIDEFDRKPEESVTQMVTLEKIKAEEIAPVIEAQLSDGSSSSSSYDRYSYWRRRNRSTMAEKIPFTATPVESSNSLILKGTQRDVEEAMELVMQLDVMGRPDGPMVRVFLLEFADVYDTISFLEDMLGIGYSYDSFGGTSGSGSGSGGSAGKIVLRPEYTGNQLIVSAPFERMPMIESLIKLRENQAEIEQIEWAKLDQEGAVGRGKPIGRDGKFLTKEYDLPEDFEAIDEVVSQLSKVLEDYYGYMDSPYVKSFPFTRKIIIEAKPEQFQQTETFLADIMEDPPQPRVFYFVTQVGDGVSAMDVASQMFNIASASTSMKEGLNMMTIPRSSSAQDAIGILEQREILHNTPIERPEPMVEDNEATTKPAGSSLFIAPVSELAAMHRELASLSWVQTAEAELEAKSEPDTEPKAEPAVATSQPASGTVADNESDSASQSTESAAPAVTPEIQQSRDILRKALQGARQQTQIVVDEEQRLIICGGVKRAQDRETKAKIEHLLAQLEMNTCLGSSPWPSLPRLARSDRIEAGYIPARLEFVPPAAQLAAMQRELASLSWVQTAEAEPEAEPKPDTEPKAEPAVATTQPASRTVADNDSEATSSSIELSPTVSTTESTAAAPKAPPASAVTPEVQQSRDILRNALKGARQQTQIVVDEEKGLIYVIGKEPQLKSLDVLLTDLVDRAKQLVQDAEDDRPIRVFPVKNVDVAIAANILETMFNEQAARGGRKQPQQAKPDEKKPQEGEEGEEEGPSRRREEEQEEQQKELEAQARQAGQRIKVYPDPRTQTLIIKADAEMFPRVAELLLKIDRPGRGLPVDIKLFRLKKLNAYEVEQTLKAVLKIEDPERMRRRPRGGPNADASQAADMIERMEERMLEMQKLQQQQAKAGPQEGGEDGTPGGLKLNPSKDISITSDSTTNTVIVSAPEQGMMLVEELINELEAQEIPIRIELFTLDNAPAEMVAEELQKIFQAQRGPRGGDPDGFTPSRMGDVKFAANARTNTIVVRALEPDIEKIRPIVKEFDESPDEGLVQIYTVQRADVSSMAQSLTSIYVDDTQTGPLAVRITPDEDTGTLLVRAPEAKQMLIANKIKEIDEIADTRATPREIQLTLATASSVADKLTQIFAGRTAGALRRQIQIVGDDNSKILFVSAPDEVFKQIEDVAMQLDQDADLDFRVYPLEFAFAEEVHARFREMMAQLLSQMGGGGDLNVAVTPDPRTNSLIVSGSPKIFLLVEKVLADLDVEPEGFSEITTSMFYLQKANPSSLASTITSLYSSAKFPGGVAPPRAVAVPTSSLLYVYGTKKQIQDIKAQVIDPYEEAIGPDDFLVEDYVIPVQHADVEDVANRLSRWFSQRFANMRAAGATNIHPSQQAVSIIADPSTKSLLISATKENKALIDKMLAEFDTTEDYLKPPETVRLVNARASDVARTLDQMIRRSMPYDRTTRTYPVTVQADDASNTLVLAGREREMTQVKELITQLDVPQPEDNRVVRSYMLTFADLGSVQTAINTQFSDNAKQPIQNQISLTPDYTNNVLMVTASDKNHEKIKNIIDDLDDSENARIPVIENIALLNARASDVATTLNDIIRRTKRIDRRTRTYPITVTANNTTNTLVVTAYQEEMEWARTLIADLDVEPTTADDRVVRSYDIEYVDIGSVNTAINARFSNNANKPIQDQISVTPDYANSKLIVSASAENHQRLAEIIEEVDSENIGKTPSIETIEVVNARASDVAGTLNELIRRTKRRDRKTGTYPITVTADNATNTLVVTAYPKEMEEAKQLIAELDVERPDVDDRPLRSYALQYADPRSVQTAINARFSDNAMKPIHEQVTITLDGANNTLLIAAPEDKHEQIKGIIDDLDTSTLVGMQPPVTIKLQHVRASDLERTLTQMIRTSKRPDRRTRTYPVTVTADDAANTLLVTAATEKDLEEIRVLIDTLDQPLGQDDNREAVPYELEFADVGSVMNVIRDQFKNNDRLSTSQQISVVPVAATNMIVVTASPENHAKIAMLLENIDKSGIGTRKSYPITLINADPNEVARSLTTIYNNAMPRSRTGRVPAVFTAVPGSKQVVVTANASEMEEIRALIDEFDRKAGPESDREMRVLPVSKLAAAEMADLLREYLSPANARRGAPLPGDTKIIASTGADTVVIAGTKERLDELEQLAAQIEEQAGKAIDEPPGREVHVFNVSYADPRTLAQGITRTFGKTGRNVPEIEQVEAVGDPTTGTVIVNAAPSKLERIKQVVEKLDTETANVPRQEVVKVKHADANDLAQVLTQTYRYARRSRNSPQISVQAEPSGDALVISAGETDMEGIKELIGQLDIHPEMDVEELRVIPLQYVDAQETLTIMQDHLSKPGGRRGRRGSSDLIGDIKLQASSTLNALVVSGSSEEIDSVESKIKTIDVQVEGAANAPKIIKLEKAVASELANTLSDMFTTPAQRARRSNPESIPLIMADDATNSLVVRARSMDYVLIEDMARKLDTSDDTGGLEIIPLTRGVDAQRLAQEIERTINRGESYSARQRPGKRPGQVAIGVDTRAPALIVAGSPELFPAVQKLVDTLQELEPAGRMGARVVPVNNVPSRDMQRVLIEMLRSQGIEAGR